MAEQASGQGQGRGRGVLGAGAFKREPSRGAVKLEVGAGLPAAEPPGKRRRTSGGAPLPPASGVPPSMVEQHATSALTAAAAGPSANKHRRHSPGPWPAPEPAAKHARHGTPDVGGSEPESTPEPDGGSYLDQYQKPANETASARLEKAVLGGLTWCTDCQVLASGKAAGGAMGDGKGGGRGSGAGGGTAGAAEPIPLVFESPEQYVSILEPVLHDEARAAVQSAWQVGKTIAGLEVLFHLPITAAQLYHCGSGLQRQFIGS